jgi:K+-transporting ATPase KdpF subunit
MKAVIVLAVAQPQGNSTSAGYIIGGVIAVFILGYLLYSLVKPEKF